MRKSDGNGWKYFFKMATVWILAVVGVFVVAMMVYLHLLVGE